jgi:hypothetical protein
VQPDSPSARSAVKGWSFAYARKKKATPAIPVTPAASPDHGDDRVNTIRKRRRKLNAVGNYSACNKDLDAKPKVWM